MKTLFFDCNHQLAPIFARVHRPDDPPIAVNTEPFRTEDLPRLLEGCAIALDDHSAMPTGIVAQCPALKHIVFLGTGAASYMNIAELNARGITVHTIRGYGDIAVAEHNIALMFASARNVAQMDRALRDGVWKPLEGFQLFGKTLGVIGLGGIGREVARMGAGLGMNVIGWNRTPRNDIPVPLVDIDTLLERSDVVSMNLVLSEETRHFLDAARIARMKQGAIFVNTARGALVDEDALIAALQSGHLAHAGLDVFESEPLPAGHPFANMSNVTITSHAAYRTQEASMTLLRRGIDIVKSIIG
jgi:D-3-phosphoglycerate dehydrogenase